MGGGGEGVDWRVCKVMWLEQHLTMLVLMVAFKVILQY